MNIKNWSTDEMIYNKITLSFPEKTEKLFRKKYFFDSIIQLRVALLLVILLYGLFGYLDLQMFPEYASLFLKIRFLFVIPIALMALFLSYTKIFQRVWQPLLLFCFFVGGTGISIMTMLEPENYGYHAGMMLVFFSGYLFIKLRFFMASISGWSTLLIFNLIAIFYADAPYIVILSSNFFFISANLIGMFAGYHIELQIRRNYFLNQKIDEEKLFIQNLNKNLEKTVEERTKELVSANEISEEINANMTAILEGTVDNIWAFNKNFEILYINKVFQNEFYQTFGVLLEPGVSLIESLPKPLQPFWKTQYERVLANEQFIVEDAVDTDNGKIYIQIAFNPIVKQGKIVGGSCFGSNITHRKLSEIELVKAKEHAEESDQLKSAFLANMSHEIRTPMNGILGFAELLKEQNLTGEEQKEYIGIIVQSGHRMLSIINDLVDISKIEAGLMEVVIRETNIIEHIKYIYSFFKPEAESKGLHFLIKDSLLADEMIIKTDPEKLYAILANLIKNAIKYTNEGSIEFGYEIKGLYIEFFIKDTGIGIPLNRQSSIFERFIQAEISDKMAQQGAGLGLSITAAFLKMLGGEIWVESEKGLGSTFYFTLPYNYEKNT